MDNRIGRVGATVVLWVITCTSAALAQPRAAEPEPSDGPSAGQIPAASPAKNSETGAKQEAVESPPAAPQSEPAAEPVAGSTATVAGRQDSRDQKAEALVPTSLAALAPTASKADDQRTRKKPWKKKPKLSVSGRVYALYRVVDFANRPSNEFRLRSARVQAKWKEGSLIEAVAEAELSHEEEVVSAWAPLRDAYVRLKPMRALRLQAGQFKKPFSRLELLSRRRLAAIERGIANDWIISSLGYGGRDTGVQLDGKLGKYPSLEYAAGIFNGNGTNQRESDPDGSKDVVVRLSSQIAPWLNVGADASQKRFDRQSPSSADFPRSALMTGLDFGLKLDKLNVTGEAMYGDNYAFVNRPMSWSTLLLVSYKFAVAKDWALAVEPVLQGELMKVEHDVIDGHLLAGAAGANLHIGRTFRLMLQGDIVRAAANVPADWRDESRLSLQAAFDTP